QKSPRQCLYCQPEHPIRMLGSRNISAPPRGNSFYPTSAARPAEAERFVFARKFSPRALIAVAIAALTLTAGGLLLARARGAAAVAQVPFSDLLRHLEDAEVKEVVVNGDTLDFRLRTGQAVYRTVSPPGYVTANAAFVPELARKGVRIEVQTVPEQS